MQKKKRTRFTPGTSIGGYLLEEFLGNGTFGEVYRATRPTDLLRHEYAVKIPYPQFVDEDSVTNEARIGFNVSGHANVIGFVGADLITDGPHGAEELLLVSAFCSGGSLRQLLNRRQAPLAEEEAVALMEQVCAGVAHLHAQNVFHRDLKPDNILLHEGVAKVGDFGISRLTERSRSYSAYAGTEQYMSPEAFDGVYAASVDVWALGVIFYELLTGRLPFVGETSQQRMKAILTQEPAPLPAHISAHLQSAILRAISKDTNERLTTVKQFQVLLEPPPAPPVKGTKQRAVVQEGKDINDTSNEVTFENLGMHRLKGVGEEHLGQVGHPRLQRVSPSVRTLNPERHNLPLPSTPFIGREEEIRKWNGWLHKPTTRLLTLTGSAGIGKTRVALQLAELCLDDFAEGVWWVPLDNVKTGEEMIQRIAEQLRLYLQPQWTVREQLWRFLKERPLLLVLDNTEQIQGQEPAEVVYGLLNAGPHIKCLVTSRRSLDLAAERLVELEPLPASDAEALFVERARARKAGFALTEQNAADVAAICRALEGVPLAIEMAASLIVLLTPRQILQRLGDLLDILILRNPTLPPRQRALRAAIEWSYTLLTKDARTLFAQLAIFVGGFTLEAAEAVCKASDLLENLLELRTHSLLRAETDAATQQERLLMLESVRLYAAEQLTDAEVQRRHAEYFLRFAEERVECLHTRDEARALDELDADFDNLRAALTWTQANGQGTLCLGLALALHQPLHLRGFWTEAWQCLQTGRAASDRLEGETAAALRARLELKLASLTHDRGNRAAARAHAGASLVLYRELNDRAGIADALNLLGLLHTEEDDGEAAQPLFEEALRLRAADDHSGRAQAQHNLARLAARRGDAAQAWRLYEESLRHRRAASDARGEAITLGNLGALAQQAGDLVQARRLYNESLALRRTLREPFGIAVMLNNLAELAELEGDLERAVTLFVPAERIFRDLQSAHAATPAEALERFAGQLGVERFAALRRAAEQTPWEEVV